MFRGRIHYILILSLPLVLCVTSLLALFQQWLAVMLLLLVATGIAIYLLEFLKTAMMTQVSAIELFQRLLSELSEEESVMVKKHIRKHFAQRARELLQMKVKLTKEDLANNKRLTPARKQFETVRAELTADILHLMIQSRGWLGLSNASLQEVANWDNPQVND